MTRVVGHYEIRRRLGSGGGGVVYEAVDSRLGRRVVLKRLHHASNREKALAEARVLSAIEHPNVCTLFDVVEAGGATWLVLPRVEGDPLDRLIRRGPLPIPLLLSVGAQVADGLEAAHRLGVVHRDLKPSNVMVSPDGLARILDFGLARGRAFADADAEANGVDSGTSAPCGTIAYMAPEQFETGRLTPAADLFALGVLLHEAATGSHPYRPPIVGLVDQGFLQRAIRFHEPEPLRRNRPDAPEAFEALLDRCLAKQPEHRPASAAEVARTLRALARERGDDVRPLPQPVPPAAPGFLARVLGRRAPAPPPARARARPRLQGPRRGALPAALREAYLEANSLLAATPEATDARARLYRAEDRLAEVLLERPSFAPARAALGRAHLEAVRLGLGGPVELVAAEACLAEALEHDASLVEADLARAVVRLARGEKPEARRDVQRLLARHPSVPAVRLAAASLLRLDGLHAEALAELDEALSLDPRGAAAVHEARARLLQYADRFDEAEREIERGLRLEPTHPGLRTSLGHLHLRRGDVARAATVLRDVVRNCPGVRLAHPTLALALLRLGQREEALALLGHEVRSAADADGDMAYRVATVFAAAGEETPALSWLTRARELGNENWPWLATNPAWRILRERGPVRLALAASARGHRAARRSWEAFHRRTRLQPAAAADAS